MSRPTVIKIAVWGGKFVQAAADTVFACLLAPGQLDDPLLREAGDVIVHVTIPPHDRDLLETSGVLARLRNVAKVEIAGLPDGTSTPAGASHLTERRRLAVAEYNSLLYAQRLGADWIPLNADTLISNRFVAAVKKRLLAGRKAVAGSPFRTEREGFEAEAGARRDFSATELYLLSLRHMHAVTLGYFLRKTPAVIPAAPHMVMFTTGDGFAAHSVQLCPYGIDTRCLPASYPFDGLTLDCRMLSDVLADKDYATACWLDREAPGDAYLTALDDAAGIASFGRFEVTVAQVARSARHFMRHRHDLKYFRWSVAQRVAYAVPEALRTLLPTDCVDEAEAIARIAEQMRLGWRRSIALNLGAVLGR